MDRRGVRCVRLISIHGVHGRRAEVGGSAIYVGTRPKVRSILTVSSCTSNSYQSVRWLLVSAEYFCNLDANFLRLDHAQRPELNKGTVDFAVSDAEAYWAPHPPERINPSYISVEPPPASPASTLGREPKPMDYLFAFDVSIDAVSSGFLRTACESLKEILYGEDSCFPSECRVGILAFHSELHFYDLSVSGSLLSLLV